MTWDNNSFMYQINYYGQTIIDTRLMKYFKLLRNVRCQTETMLEVDPLEIAC